MTRTGLFLSKGPYFTELFYMVPMGRVSQSLGLKLGSLRLETQNQAAF